MRQAAHGHFRPRRAGLGLRSLGLALALTMSIATQSFAAQGDITTVAGNGVTGYAGDNGPATSAQLNTPAGVAFGGLGDLFIADYYAHTIRKVAPGGTITTLAGTGVSGYSGDSGPATAARLNQPGDIAIDAAGNVYIADFLNSRIRKVAVNGIISTFAGTGVYGYTGDNGPASLARLGNPVGLDIDASGNLYVADYSYHTVRKITPAGVISTIAGTGVAGYSGDNGPATSARMNAPGDVAVDGAGNAFIAEFSGHRVRRVSSGGTITTVAGTGTQGYSGEGGPGTAAQLSSPAGVDVDSTGNLFIAEFGNHVIRRVDPSGTITRVAGIALAGFSGDNGPATSAALYSPSRVSLSPDGDFYVSDWGNHRVRHVDALGSPEAPTLTATSPASPAPSNSPLVVGSSQSDWTVRLYTNSTCTSAVAATGTAGQLADPGLSVTVPDDSTTTFFATATDSFGNVSGCSTSSVTYVEDSTDPAAPSIDSSPGSPGSDTTPTWSFTGEAGASYECRLDRGATVVVDWAACSSPKTYDLASQPDGTYTFSVRATDAAGNRGPDGSGSYELDTSTPAAPSIDSPPPSPGNDASPSWGFSGEAGATFDCRLDRGATVVAGWAPCSSPRSYDVSAEPDGSYTFAVRQTDAAGNTSSAATDDYALDTAAPVAPTIGPDPGATGADDTPAWGVTGEGGAPFECRLTRGAAVVFDWATCFSPRTYDVSAEPDGTYTFSVRQTDAAGNTGAAQSHDYTLDRSIPAAPSIDSEPASPDNSTAPSWTFSGVAGATFECRLARMDGTAVLDWSACSSPRAYSLAAELDGAYEFSVRQTDGAGNTSPAATGWYVLDTTAGVAPSIDAAPPSPGSDISPTWDFSGEAGATFECRVERGPTVVFAWGACSAPAAFDLSGEPDGTYTFSVRQVDGAGNVSPAAGSGYELDSQAPGAPSIDSGPASPGTDASPTFAFSGEPGGFFECRLEDGAGQAVSGFGWAACSSPKSYDLSSAPDGTYNFAARQIDAAGGTGPAATRGYVLDTTAPSAPVFTAEPPLVGSATNPSWSFTSEAGAALQCRVERGATVVSDWAACLSPHTLDLSGEPDGLYAFSVRAIDAAGNTGAAASDLYALDRSAPAAPVITGTPGAVGNDSTPAWSFTVEAGALPECRLERGPATVSDWQPCASPASYDLTAEPDAAYRFLVRARDAAGNAGSPAQSDYVLDRTAPPAPTIDSTPGAVGSSRTPAWSFTGEPGAVHDCRLTNEGAVVSDWAPCNGSASYDLAGAPDGSYTFSVRSGDEAGNTGPAASSDYRLDTTGAEVTIDAGPGPLGNAPSPSWAFSGEPGARFECALDLDGSVAVDWASCASPRAYDLSGQPDGDYTFRARSRDGVDNVGAVASYAYTLDRVAPPAPAFTDSPGALGRDATPRWALAAEDAATIECRLLRGGAALGDWEPCAGSVSRDLSATGDGGYALVARATDRAGNVSGSAQSGYRLDATAPGAPDITDGPGSSGRARRVSWAFTGEPAAAFECRLTRGTAVLDPWGPCSSPARFSLFQSELGDHAFRVRARDEAGNQGPSTSSDYALLAPHDDEEPREDDEPRDGGADQGPAEAPAPPPPAEQPAPSPVAPLVSLRSLADPDASAAAMPPDEQRKGAEKRARAGRDDDRDRSAGANSGISLDDNGAPATEPRAAERPAGGRGTGKRLLDALGDTAAFVARNLDKTGFPLVLLLLVLGYVAVQNRLDSRDPKLALAPIHADRDLEFLPPPSPNVAFLLDPSPPLTP